jgi:RNA polymerase sigma-70 factor, ECF subfamily
MFPVHLAKSPIPWATESAQPSMMQRAEDLELIHRLQAGDDDAVRDLYARYGQRLYAYALRLTDDPAMAEDITQNTLIIAWRSMGSFRGEGRLIAWLLGIVHHTAMKSLRDVSIVSDPATEELVRDRRPSPEEQAEGREMKRRVRDGLASLSLEHRTVLELVFYQGLSLTEVAEVLDCPLGTVKSRLSYARQNLRAALTRMEESWP